MPLTNNLKVQVDQPVFEYMRFAPTATSATSALASSDDGTGRFFYYIVGQALWRYDTYSDSWQELAPPNIAPVTGVALKYSAFSGYRGHVIAATTNTITIGSVGPTTKAMVGMKIRILFGTGAGQERTITSADDPIIHDLGLATAASATALTDSTKKWRFNQWDGYTCRIAYGTGQGQIRTVLYNDQTTLTFADTNWQQIDPFNNTGFSAVAPYAVPVVTAGLQAHFTIESVRLTLDTNWEVTPDASSIFQVISGGLWLFSSAAAAPFSSFQYYDILRDTWYTKTANGGQLTAAWGTEFSLERTGEIGGAFISGLTATSAAAKTLVNTGAGMSAERWTNYQLRIVSGLGVGQRRRISGNTSTTFLLADKWDVIPDNTSQYQIFGNTDRFYLVGNNAPTLWSYSVENDLWRNGPMNDAGIGRSISATPLAGTTFYGPPHEGIALASIVRTTSGILTVAVNAGGTGYQVGDLVTLSTTGTNGAAFVTSIDTNGAATGLQLAASGSGYVAGSSNTTGGAGSGLTITITVGTTGLVTTATGINHDFRTGDLVRLAGFATDTTFNADFTIIGVGSLTTFSIACPSSTASPTIGNAPTTSLLVDATKMWNTNEHVGRIVHVLTAGVSPTLLGSRRISSNTSNTLTLNSALSSAQTNGQTRYVIQEPRGSGAALTELAADRLAYGYATSGTATTLVDSTKNWTRGQWVGFRVRVVAGTGEGNEAAITANTQTTLTVASWGVATPDATSRYEIMESNGIVTTGAATTTITDAAKNWKVNSLGGKRGRIIAGTGVGTDFTVNSNTATVLTVAATITTDTTSQYVLYDGGPRAAGANITWIYNPTEDSKKGRRMISPRGGGATIFDVYDIPTESFIHAIFPTPASITLGAGSMYAYDGAKSYLFTKEATGRVYEMDLDTFEIKASTITPYVHNAAAIGNRMEIIQTVDGLKYIYIMRHTGQEMWRSLKFW